MQIFDNMPYTFVIADLLPDRIRREWRLSTIKRLVIVLSICGIGEMTPGTFEVMMSETWWAQYESLSIIIGMWPDVREIPLEQIRLDFQASSLPSHKTGDRGDLIRVIKTFKRTSVWAETGDCSSDKNGSFLLPLTRAFNQARRYWVKEADFENPLLVSYDKHELEEGQDEKARDKWKIEPSNDTSQTDNHQHRAFSKVGNYIKSKMVQKNVDGPGLTCEKCLAHFENRKEYCQHLQRGKWRDGGRPVESSLISIYNK